MATKTNSCNMKYFVLILLSLCFFNSFTKVNNSYIYVSSPIKKMKISAIILTLFFIIIYGCKNKQKKVKQENSISNVQLKLNEIKIINDTNYDFAFLRGFDSIFIYDSKNKIFNFVTLGQYPCLSNDGNKIAFTTSGKKARRIIIFDIKSKIKEEIKINTCVGMDPIWCPNGKYIAFNILQSESDWKVAIYDLSLKKIKHIYNNIPGGVYSPTWTADGNKLLMHNMDSLYFLDLNGNILNKFLINEGIAKQHCLSSSSRFFLTKDEKYLIFSVDYYSFRNGLTLETTGVILSYNIKTCKLKQLTPFGLSCSSLFLSPNNTILFCGTKTYNTIMSSNRAGGRYYHSIYEISIDKGTIVKLIENAQNPSCEK